MPKTLKREIDRLGRLPASECLRVSLALTEALEHLHARGLVHRDIKPSNIIFVDGVPKLADIGLVAPLGEAKTAVGTEGFMAPEGPGTAQADIYSLGKVLYEMSTGKDRHQFPEPPTWLGQQTDRLLWLEFNEVVQRACAPDPRQRYASATELRADLLLLQSGRSVRRLRRTERVLGWCKRLALVGVGLLALGIGALVFQHHQTRLARQLAEESQARLLRLHTVHGLHLMDGGDYLAAVVWFTEALKLARTPQEEQVQRYRIALVQRQCPVLLHLGGHSKALNHAEFSPDGRRLLTIGAEGLWRLWDVSAVLRQQTDWRPGPSIDTELSPGAWQTLTRLWQENRALNFAPGHSVIALSADGRRVLTRTQ